MRVRTSLILDETLLAQIDELAGEKQRRAALIETALREYLARARKAAVPKPTNGKSPATVGGRR